MSKLWISAGLEVPSNVNLQAAKKALIELARVTITEPGCYQFDILQNKENPNLFTLWECFEDEQALKDHFDMPYTLSFIAKGYTTIQYAERLTRHTDNAISLEPYKSAVA